MKSSRNTWVWFFQTLLFSVILVVAQMFFVAALIALVLGVILANANFFRQ